MVCSITCVPAQQHATHVLRSAALAESRLIEVALPTNYSSHAHAYPVLYLLDGEYIFEYATGTVDFLSNPFGFLPEILVVSIPNTDRMRDFHSRVNIAEGDLPFVSFLLDEVKPFIEKNYRTNGFDLLYGWSSASNICTYLFTIQPNSFNAYLTSGSGVGPNFAEFMQTHIPEHSYDNIWFYGITESNTPRAKSLQRMAETIDNIGDEGLQSNFVIDSHSNHVDVLANGIRSGLEFVFSDFYISAVKASQGADSIITYYSRIIEAGKFNVVVPVGAINESAATLFQTGKIDQAIKLLEYGLELHPYSVDLNGSMGELHLALENIEMAKSYLIKAIESSSNDIKSFLKYSTLLKNLN